jgi:dienelactone hydrolase
MAYWNAWLPFGSINTRNRARATQVLAINSRFASLITMNTIWAATFFALVCLPLAAADKQDKPASVQEQALSAYFEQQVSAIEGQLEREVQTKESWLAKKDEYRRQLAEMLGLDPMPPRTDLKPVKVGEFEHEGIIVEKLHFQAMPGLYVTANFFRPKVVEKPLPTILYVCGHANKSKDGISFGNKAGYEHHGVWYAKHGFVCLVIDTVELGEIHGEHHGTYSKGRFWWWSRGYTPAGVEAWQGIRALDYLETRPEVDKTRFGVTGRSGGGAYSWYIAALDERIKAVAPTAGITTLRNHVVDGCVEGHCDCMFMNNTYRWDYDKVAALVAPRALCIVNTDKDGIFPIDGVFKIYQSTRRIYKMLDAEKNIGLQFAEGPHADTQPLNTGEFHWMTRFLQAADAMSTLDSPAVHSIPMERLRVFNELPKDETNTKLDESFVPMAAAKVSESGEEWGQVRDGWIKAVRDKCFGAWSGDNLTIKLAEKQVSKAATSASTTANAGTVVVRRRFMTIDSKNPLPQRMTARQRPQSMTLTASLAEADITVDSFATSGEQDAQLVVMKSAKVGFSDLELIVLNVLDEEGWQEFANTYAHKFPGLFPAGTKATPDDNAFQQEKKMFENFKWGMAYVCPRGIGPTAWDSPRSGDTPVPNTELGGGAAKINEADKSVRAPSDEKTRVQRLRRFYLLGQTLEGQQVWDVRCAIRALRSIEGLKDTKLWLQAYRTQAANSLIASLFEDNIARLDLHELPHSLMPTTKDKDGHPISGFEPVYLNMLKYLDLPQAAAMAAERTRVVIYDDDKAAWSFPAQTAEKLGWGKEKKNGLQLRDVPKPE